LFVCRSDWLLVGPRPARAASSPTLSFARVRGDVVLGWSVASRTAWSPTPAELRLHHSRCWLEDLFVHQLRSSATVPARFPRAPRPPTRPRPAKASPGA